MKPLYQALICFLVKFVFSIKKSKSSFVSFCLLLEPPISARMTSPLLWLHSTQCQQQAVVVLHDVIVCPEIHKSRDENRCDASQAFVSGSRPTVSYSPSVVTMTVSLAISEIFSVKEWPNLETWVWGLLKSLKMAPFDRPYTTYDWSAIVTIALYCTIFELLTLNNYRDLEFWLGGHSRSLKWCHSKTWVRFPIRLLVLSCIVCKI